MEIDTLVQYYATRAQDPKTIGGTINVKHMRTKFG
jgi:hypothetical protein